MMLSAGLSAISDWRVVCVDPTPWCHQRRVFAPPPAEASEIVHQDAPPILNSVRAWARLLHVSASRGLRPTAAEPQIGARWGYGTV